MEYSAKRDNCNSLMKLEPDVEKTMKIGVFDFETMSDSNGAQVPYYIG